MVLRPHIAMGLPLTVLNIKLSKTFIAVLHLTGQETF